MSRSLLSAAKSFAAAWLVATGVFMAPVSLFAQANDPFAIERDLTLKSAVEAEKDGPGLSAIFVDGVEQKRMVDLKWIDGELAILAESAVAAGLPIEEETSGYLKLKTMQIARFEFDRITQQLTVKRYRKGDGPNDVNVARRNYDPGEMSPLLAGIVDYSLTATRSGGNSDLGAYVAPRVTYGNLILGSAFTYRTNVDASEDKLVRLNTTATLALPET